MRRVVFLCGVWSKEEELFYIENSRGGVQSAANVLQTNLIVGFDQVCEQPVTLINEVFVGAFPKLFSRLFICGGEYNHSTVEGHKDYKVEFINVPYIKHLSRYNRSKKYIKEVCNSFDGDEIVFIGYSMTSSIISGLLYAKRINPKVKTCLIIPDLPEYMNLSVKRDPVFSVLKQIDQIKIYQDIKELNGFVLLTAQMYERLGTNKPYIVMEGIAASNSIQREVCVDKGTARKIVYTGTIDRKYGICELVDAFSTLRYDDIQLVICGKGDASQYIQEMSKKDSRIQYLGAVSHVEALELQNSAYILVNPRNPKEAYTKYSFPSKTMEYMVTGNPVVMYKLEGIPKDYDDLVYFCDNNLQETLNKVLSLPADEVRQKGVQARQFVLTKKTEEAQARRIIEFIDSL